MIQTSEELIGCVDTLGRLRDIWYDLTQLTQKFRIFKEDWDMNRTTELWLHEAKNMIPDMRIRVEKSMKKIEDDIKKFPIYSKILIINDLLSDLDGAKKFYSLNPSRVIQIQDKWNKTKEEFLKELEK